MNAIPLLLIAVFFFFLSWRNARLAVAIILFLLPTYLLRFSVHGIPATVLEVLVVALVLAWVIKRVLRGDLRLSDLPWRWVMSLFLLSAIIAVFVSPDRVSALGYFKAYFLEPMLFVLVLWDTIRTKRDLQWVYSAIGGITIILFVVALLQYGGLLSSPEPWVSETPKRVVSLFDYPNALGLFVAPVVGLFAAQLLISAGSFRLRASWFSLTVVISGFASLVFAACRGGLIAALLGVVLLGLFSRYKKPILIITILGIIAVIAIPFTRTMLTKVVLGTDTSTDVRYVMWQGTFRLLRAHPIVGAGLGGFPTLYNQYRLIKHTELLPDPHNIILNAWVEVGLTGMLLFCWFCIDAFRRGIRILKRTISPFSRQMLFGALAALFILIAHGMVDVPYFKNDLALEFWFFLFLIPIIERLSKNSESL